MRKHKRAIARATMERMGIKRINKPRINTLGHPIPSIFASEWRKNVSVTPEVNKRAAKQRAAKEKKRQIRNCRRANG